jgi:hypothetical protein
MRVEQTEAQIRNTSDAAGKEALASQLEMFRSNLEGLTTESQLCPMREAEAEDRLRTEQAKMNDLDAQLDKLDKILSSLGGK